jgi:hypothetical protein
MVGIDQDPFDKIITKERFKPIGQEGYAVDGNEAFGQGVSQWP